MKLKINSSVLFVLLTHFGLSAANNGSLEEIESIKSEQINLASQSHELAQAADTEALRAKYERETCQYLDYASQTQVLGEKIAAEQGLQAPPSEYLDGRYYTFGCERPNIEAESLRDTFIASSSRFVENAKEVFTWAEQTVSFDPELAELWFQVACNKISIAASFAGLSLTSAKLVSQSTQPALGQLERVSTTSQQMSCNE